MGHLRTQQKNYKSTKLEKGIPIEERLNVSPSQELKNLCTNTMYSNLVFTDTMHKTYSDQTVNFTAQSSREKKLCFYFIQLWL